jgi:N-hydroxyarylamine O-acetyltransferase
MAVTETTAEMSVAEEADIDAYFERTGFAGSIAPSQETLGQLMAMHLRAIPFETLDPLRGKPVRLGLRDLEQKLVHEKRGGHGLEHNLLFGAVLEALFFEVTRVAALQPTGEPSHIALVVSIDGVPHLVDAGLGALATTTALRLRDGAESDTIGIRHRVTGADGQWTLNVLEGDEARPLYSFRAVAVAEEALTRMNERAAQRFAQGLQVARIGQGRRFVIDGSRYTLETAEGVQEKRDVASAAEMRQILQQHFLLVAPSDPRLDEAFERVIADAAKA